MDEPVTPNSIIDAFQTTSTGKVHALSPRQATGGFSTYPTPECADAFIQGSVIKVPAGSVDCLKCRHSLGLD